MRIVMAAAENDALPGGKVGGVGDVLRDLPLALAEHEHSVDVVTPSYGVFHKLKGAQSLGASKVAFAGGYHPIELVAVPARGKGHRHVRNLVIDSPLFAEPTPGIIYSNDSDQPFATDATRFALYSAALLTFVQEGILDRPDVLHLHDWHSALLAVLLRFDERFVDLGNIRTVFSVHNLALQGIRPLNNNASSLKAWFPDLSCDLSLLVDPRYSDCINPMRAGIRLVDRVHTVSPTYAEEILQPSDPSLGFSGGEGLEADLGQVAEEGRLIGIINGADYAAPPVKRPTRRKLWDACRAEVNQWLGATTTMKTAHYLADRCLMRWADQLDDEPMLMTSVGRLTDQKVRLLLQPNDTGGMVLDDLLAILGNQAVFLMIGSGDSDLEAAVVRVAARHDNFLFLNGYAGDLADMVYSAGDLFLMPSAFEPCGISQMLAMRAGQLCLVHAVGGLADTIEDGVTGFAFSGDSPDAQARAFLDRTEKLLRSYRRSPRKWQSMRKRAADVRFLWSDSAADYIQKLYI